MKDTSTLQVITMNKESKSQFYTVPQAAELLGVSPVTVWRWIEQDKLPAYRVGPRNIRLKKEDLERMIKPARTKDVPMDKEEVRVEPISKDELTRRKNLVAEIVAKRKERVIAPLTTADLVHKVREDETKYYAN